MYFIILDPHTKTPAILSEDEGSFVQFLNIDHAIIEGNYCIEEKLCETYMIVQEVPIMLYK